MNQPKLSRKWLMSVPPYLIVVLLLVVIAILFNRPMKVSMTENVFIEVGEGEAGPPEFYRLAIELPDGREIYLSNGSCKIRKANLGGEE
jgi:hypothetical protein